MLASSTVMVLNRQGTSAGFCSAVVVAPDVVLTAAHCVPTGSVVKVHYREGATPVLLDVAEVARHPGFRADAIATRQRSIDLALVRLSHPLPPPFHPAPLGATIATVGSRYRLAGFGLQREGVPTSSGTLRIAGVVAEAPLSDVLLWAGDPDARGTGACTGDSGGPVSAPDGTVVGIIAWSAGSGAARCGRLTQAIWIGPQRPWIAGILARWAGSPEPPPR